MQKTKLFELKIGDRFYYLSDKSRHVWQIDFIESTTRFNTFNQEVERNIYHIINDANLKKEETKNKDVVFVRSN